MSTTSENNREDGRLRDLRELVRRRRLEQGLSVSAAAALAGISRLTWTALEDGTRRTHAHIYAGVERALAWTPGSIEHFIIKGEVPSEVSTAERWPHEAFWRFLEPLARRAGYDYDLSRLAVRAGIRASLMPLWKTGQVRPTIEQLRSVATRLNVPPADLWVAAGLLEREDFVTAAVTMPDDLRDLIELYDSPDLTADDREGILATVRMAVRGTLLTLQRRAEKAQGPEGDSRRRAG